MTTQHKVTTSLRERWFAKLLGDEREDVPSSYHTAYMRRLSPLESTYTKERATEICLQTLDALGFDLNAQPNIKLDLDDRPQKSPRACVIASDPPKIVHLITRAQGGLHDYQAFLHEAGHALHYAGCDPQLPYVFRRISRDHALTEIYSYIVEAISREPEWHEQYFGLSPEQAQENAEATTFLEALLYRRYEAKLRFELDFWSRFNGDGGDADVYERFLTEATGIRYRKDNYLSDMDAGFYSADYLRAWIRSAQLRDYLVRGRRGLVAQPEDGRAADRPLPRGHEADERGDRRPARLRPARHEAAAARNRRLARPPGGTAGRAGGTMPRTMESAAHRWTLLAAAAVLYAPITSAFIEFERPGSVSGISLLPIALARSPAARRSAGPPGFSPPASTTPGSSSTRACRRRSSSSRP